MFPIGSVHEATVLHVDDKGGIVLLPYGLEAFAPKRHLAKENGGTLVADEKAEFKVLEFNRNDKRILVSHARIWEDAKRDVEEGVQKEKKVEREKTAKTVKNLQKNVEKTTLGDLGILGELKEKMENKQAADNAAAKSKAEEKAAEAKDETPEQTDNTTTEEKTEE